MTPKRTLRTALVAAVAAATLLVTSACSIQIQSAPDPSIPDDTMLIAADTGSPLLERNFNPYLANKRIAAWFVYEPLLILDNLTAEEHPWLATGYELPDPSTVVFSIRPGVEWSDGEPFTGDDVGFTFQLLKDNPALDINGIWSHMDSFEVQKGAGDDGADLVVAHLSSEDVPAASIIGVTLIVPEHLWKDVDDPVTFRDPEPVGTGPYTVGAFAPQQYAMDKNPDYWQAEKVAAEHLVLPAKNTQLDIVTKGYDWAFSYITDVEGTWVAAGNQNRYWFPPGGTISLFPNLTKAPFDDVRVRQALSLALDRQAVGDTAAEGYMQPAGQTNILLPNQQDALDPSIPDGGMITQDTEVALALLADAGYTKQGDALVDAAGTPLTLTITTANGYSDWLRGVQEVQKQWGALGIDVKVATPQPAAYQNALRNGDYDLAMGSIGGTGSLYRDFNNLLSSEYLKPAGEEASNNFERYSDPETDALLAQYKRSTDPAEQLAIVHELQNVVYDEIPAIALYYGGSWGLFSDSKFTGWPSADDPYASPKTYESTPLLLLTSITKAESE